MNNRPEPEQISVIDYLLVPMRHWVLALTVLLLMIVLALWYNARQMPIYQASATLLIDRENVRSPLTGQQMEYETYLSESLTFNSHYELITSQDVLKRVVQELDLHKPNQLPVRGVTHPPGKIQKHLDQLRQNVPSSLSDFFQMTIPNYIGRVGKNIQLLFDRTKEEPVAAKPDSSVAAIRALKAKVKVEPVEDTRLLNITVTDNNPSMSSKIANAIAGAYIQFNIDSRMQASKDTLAWLTKSLEGMKKNLEESEKEFLNYKKSMNVISLEDSEKRRAREIQDLNAAYIEARNNRYELEAKLKQLNSFQQNGADMPNLRSLASSPIIETLHQGLVKEEMALAKAREVYKKRHPKYVEMENRINEFQIKIKEQLSKEVDNLKAGLTVIRAKEGVLQKSIAELESKAIASSRNEVGYNILKRNMDMNQEVYDALLSRITEGGLTEKINVSNIRVVEKAVTPTRPVGPNKRRNLFVAIVLGLIMGVGGSFLKEYTDRSIRSEEDVERHLDLPLLSVIPRM